MAPFLFCSGAGTAGHCPTGTRGTLDQSLAGLGAPGSAPRWPHRTYIRRAQSGDCTVCDEPQHRPHPPLIMKVLVSDKRLSGAAAFSAHFHGIPRNSRRLCEAAPRSPSQGLKVPRPSLCRNWAWREQTSVQGGSRMPWKMSHRAAVDCLCSVSRPQFTCLINILHASSLLVETDARCLRHTVVIAFSHRG